MSEWKPAAALRRTGEMLWAAALRFYWDQCLLHASALTYTSLLSVVPFLALMFAVLKGLGVTGRLEGWLLTRIGLSQEVTDMIVGYVSEVNVGTLTSLGAVALLFTAISVLGNVESSLNAIWRVQSGRVWWRKLSDYLSVVLVTPFLLLAAVGVTSFLAEQEMLRLLLENQIVGRAAAYSLRLVPFGFNVVAVAVVYIVMPNRRPDFRSLAIASVVAGVSWQLLQIGYVQLQIGVARANLIYGALAQLPVTLVWIYTSWSIILAGAELAAVLEFGVEDASGAAEARMPLGIALQLMLRAGERFGGAGGGVEARQIARELLLEPAAVEKVADLLCRGGFLVAVASPRAEYALGRDPSRIDLAGLASALDSEAVAGRWDMRVRRAIERVRAQRSVAFKRFTLADLLDDGLREDQIGQAAPRREDRSA